MGELLTGINKSMHGLWAHLRTRWSLLHRKPMWTASKRYLANF